MADQVIGYRVPHPQPPERLTLEDGADFVRITFPVAPTWVYVINPSICAALAAAWTFGPVIVVFRFWRTHGMFPVAPLLRYPWHFFWVFALRLWVGPSILWIFAILDWRKYRKWGRSPEGPDREQARRDIVASRLVRNEAEILARKRDYRHHAQTAQMEFASHFESMRFDHPSCRNIVDKLPILIKKSGDCRASC